jgi:hypothetical protein
MLAKEFLMNRAKFLLAAAIVVGAVPAFAQTDVSGEWEVTINSPQGANTSRVTLKQDGEKVSGLFKSPAGELPFEGGTLTGNELKFVFTVNFQGNPLPITLTGKVDGGAITGKADFGGFAEGDWSGKKVDGATAAAAAPAAAAPTDPTAPAATKAAGSGVSGKWDLIIKTQMGDLPAAAEFVDAGGKITGTLTGPQGPISIAGTFDGNVLKLEFTAPTPNGDIPITMTGDVSGDEIAGKADFGGMGAGEWSAKRAKQ